jgi:hypothetical protein
MISNHTKITVLVGLGAMLLTSIVVSVVAAFTGSGEYPLTWIGAYFIGTVMVCLVVYEIYAAAQYRYFERLFGEMVRLQTPSLFSYDMYRFLTDSERDDVINRLVGLSDGEWDKFLEFSEEKHYFKFEELDKSIIRDIEMVRALKD